VADQGIASRLPADLPQHDAWLRGFSDEGTIDFLI
jgi:hypothetical protein